MKIKLECIFTGRQIEIKNVYSIVSDNFGVKVFTEQNGKKDMTYYSGYCILQ